MWARDALDGKASSCPSAKRRTFAEEEEGEGKRQPALPLAASKKGEDRSSLRAKIMLSAWQGLPLLVRSSPMLVSIAQFHIIPSRPVTS